MYNPEVVRPMREELTRLGIVEMRTAKEVDEVLGGKSGTVLLVINSICGCAAGGARPGVALALKHQKLPARMATVFAGQDTEATERARSYLVDLPPSSPSIALLKDGKVEQMIQRRDIEGKAPQEIASLITQAFDRVC